MLLLLAKPSPNNTAISVPRYRQQGQSGLLLMVNAGRYMYRSRTWSRWLIPPWVNCTSFEALMRLSLSRPALILTEHNLNTRPALHLEQTPQRVICRRQFQQAQQKVEEARSRPHLTLQTCTKSLTQWTLAKSKIRLLEDTIGCCGQK